MKFTIKKAQNIFFFSLFCFLPVLLFGQITEEQEAAQKMDIDFAHFFDYYKEDGKKMQKLSGEVELSQDSIFMYCDTAVIENEVNVFAIGNIIIQQNDSITVFADSLFYGADTKIADLYGNVILKTGERKLYTTHLIYDLNTKIATYTEGAILTDEKTQLRSKLGYYYVDQNEIFFKDSVEVVDSNFTLRADTLIFNTETKIVSYAGPTLISMDSSRIYCEAGFYDTENNIAEFWDDAQYFSGERKARADTIAYHGNKKEYSLRGHAQSEKGKQFAKADVIRYEEPKDKLFLEGNAEFRDSTRNIKANIITYDGKNETYSTRGRGIIVDESRILQADQVDYEEETGLGIATGDVIWQDTVEKMTIICERAAYHRSNGYLKASGGKNGRPFLINVVDGDSLFMAADTLLSIQQDSVSGDSSRVLLAYHDVRVYKSNLQALADSVAYSSSDSIFHFYGNPIMWSDTSQFTADTLDMQLSDNQIDKIFMKNNALIVNSPDELFYNQVKGKNIKVDFKDGELFKMYVEGNAETVYYARDDSSAYIAVNKTVCSEMVLTFGNNKVERIKFITSPQSTLMPMRQANHESLRLKGFKWEKNSRPKGLADLFGENRRKLLNLSGEKGATNLDKSTDKPKEKSKLEKPKSKKKN